MRKPKFTQKKHPPGVARSYTICEVSWPDAADGAGQSPAGCLIQAGYNHRKRPRIEIYRADETIEVVTPEVEERVEDMIRWSDDELRRYAESIEWGALAHMMWALTKRDGVPPGSFSTALCEAFILADTNNQRRLGKAFPDHLRALRLMRTSERARRIAKEVL